MRLSDLEQAIRTDYRLAGRTATTRLDTAFAHLRAYFGADALASTITADRLAEYAAARLEDAASGTVRTELALFARAFRILSGFGKVEVPRFPHVKASSPRKGFVDEAQFDQVLRECPPETRAVAEFLGLTGWRVSEALGLRWTAVDWTAGTVRLEEDETKGREARTFPFQADPRLRELLRERRACVDAIERRDGSVIPWVFCRRHGQRIASIRWAWERAVTRAGFPGLLVHDLRRTVVRRLERAGVPRSVAMKITGHRSEAVYRRYAICNEADIAQGVARAAEYRRKVLRESGKNSS